MRPILRARRLRRIRRVLSGLAVGLGLFGLVLPPPLAPPAWGHPAQEAAGAGTATSAADLEALQSGLTESFRLARLGLRDIPREAFDPAALGSKLGHDPARALAFLRERTSLVPYRGSLRGARGVLMDGTGNSLDRALLLAALLDDGKREIRLARAEAASRWVETSLLPRVGRPAAAGAGPPAEGGGTAAADPLAEVPDGVRDALGARRLELDRDLELIADRVGAQAPALAAALPPAPEDGGATAADTIRVLADHWWVRYRAADAEWTDLDPTSPAGPPGEPASTFEPETLPEELYHSVTIRAVVERLEGGSLTRETALERRLRVADVHGRPVRLSYVPLSWPNDLQLVGDPQALQQRLKQAVAEQTEWLPVLAVGRDTLWQSSFFETGDLNENPNLTVSSKKLARAQSALSKLGGGGRTGILSGAWVEYDVASPGRLEPTQARTVFDLLEPEARDGVRPPEARLDAARHLERGFALVGTIDLLLLGGNLNVEHVTDLSLRNLLANRRGALGVLEAARRDRPEDTNAQLAKFVPFPGELLSLALLRLHANPAQRHLYVGEPNVLSRWTRSRLDAGGRPVASVVVDIISNRLEVVPGTGVDARRLRVEQGVIDTVAEAVIARGPSSGPVANASQAYEASTSRSIAWRTVREAGDPFLKSLDAPAHSRRAILRDLSNGYAVVLPEAASKDGAFSWWRVRQDGQTLGMLGAGEGAAVPEYLVVLGMVVTALTTWLIATACLSTGAGPRCYICGGVMGVALSLSLSFLLATAKVTATLTVSAKNALSVASVVSASLMLACASV